MGCENVGTSATSLPLEIINPVKSTKSYPSDCQGLEGRGGGEREEGATTTHGTTLTLI